MDSITVGQLGCGYWGPNLLRNFAAREGCRVKWVADASDKRRQFVTTHHPTVQTTDDWRAVVADPEVDAVVVATPASTHVELVRAALSTDKHVLVEKPLAMSVADADELVALAEARGRTLMVGHTFLYNEAVRYVKRLIDDAELGDIYYLYSQRLNLGQVRQDVNAWWNLAPHDVSVLMYLMGDQMPATVSARGVAYIQDGIEDIVFAVLTWPSGITAHVHVSWLDPGKTRRMTVVGSRKMVVYDDIDENKVAIVDKGVQKTPMIGDRMDYDSPAAYRLLHRQGDIHLPRIEFREPLRVETEHFLACVRDGAAPLTGPRHARDVVAVLEAGQRSIASGGAAVPVEA